MKVFKSVKDMRQKKTKNLFIITACSGAGKTTVSFTILPEILSCKEFINADEIARGLSPFQPEKVSVEAGRIMLHRIDELLEKGEDFAFETTLSARSYTHTILKAQEKNYTVTLIFFWLNSVELAKKRVEIRVNEGGHFIPTDVIERRYHAGLKNLFELYLPICDIGIVYDNSENLNLVFEKLDGGNIEIYDLEKYKLIKNV